MIKIFNKEKQSTKIIFVDKTSKETKNFKFEGKFGEICFNNKSIYVGTQKENMNKNDWRQLGYNLGCYISKLNLKSYSIETNSNCSEFIEGMFLSNYKFNKYKSEKKEDTVIKVFIKTEKYIGGKIKKALIKVNSQFLTRDLVNTIPEEAQSTYIESVIMERFKKSENIKVSVYNEDKLKKENMNGHLAVNRASVHPAKTIKIEYTPKQEHKKVIVLVGKGLTYDSGGLSLKPATNMTTMKADKAGAMTVYGIIDAISKLESEHKIVCYLGIAENMVGGNAYKPDDIITMKNGKTVHIKNTDAEGRIVLFDNLCLAQEENPDLDEIYSLATLTGAAVFQFGDEAAGMVGFNDKMKKVIKKIGIKQGEIFINAEFHEYMMKSVNDELADLSNTGTKNMGCQKAGLFLTNAITKENKEKYLHLDIAGPAFVEAPFGTNPVGGTGFGVRTFISYLRKK